MAFVKSVHAKNGLGGTDCHAGKRFAVFEGEILNHDYTGGNFKFRQAGPIRVTPSGITTRFSAVQALNVRE